MFVPIVFDLTLLGVFVMQGEMKRLPEGKLDIITLLSPSLSCQAWHCRRRWRC